MVVRTLGRGLLAVFALMAVGPVEAASHLRLERVVLLMRHGVRPPTKNPAMPAGIAAEPWPSWPVAPGYLTPHGAAAVRLLGIDDRQWLVRAALLPRGHCPAAGAVLVQSDSDERTIATGDAYLAGLAPGCAIANRHRPQDVADPLFLNAGENDAPFDPDRANVAVLETLGRGGIAAAETAQRAVLTRLDRILCGHQRSNCGVGDDRSRVVAASAGKRPKLAGALDRGSTAAQILLLEYAEGMPPAAVGWGRASPADITALSALHSTEFAILARPHYLAARNIAPIAKRLGAALTDRRGGAPRLVALIGHDSNVASLGGLLDLHWQVPGFARDDPAPGGAILLELLRDGRGRRFVRAGMRGQSLDQIRTLARTPAYRKAIAIGTCGILCPLDRFTALLRQAD